MTLDIYYLPKLMVQTLSLAKTLIKFLTEFLHLELGVKLYKAQKLWSTKFGHEFWTGIAKKHGYAKFIPPSIRGL
jgi:hypothetical protein